MPAYKRLLVASAKGGVGKSTTSLGVANAFVSGGMKTLLVDFDMTSHSLDLLAGVSDQALFNVADYIKGSSLEQCLLKSAAGVDGLDMIASCYEDELRYEDELLCKDEPHDKAEPHDENEPSDDSDNPHEAAEESEKPDAEESTDNSTANKDSDFIREGIERLICEAEKLGYEKIVCDTGGGVAPASRIASLFDMVLVTSEQSRTSIRAAEYAGELLSRAGAKNVRLVVCAFDASAVKREKRAGIVEMIDDSSLKCIGVVPFDKKIQKLQDSGIIPSKTVSAAAYSNIAARLDGKDVPLFSGIGMLRRKLLSVL